MDNKTITISAEDKVLVSANTLARYLNLNVRQTNALSKEGLYPLPVKGKYELYTCVLNYIRNLQKRGGASVETAADYHVEKGRLTKAQADKVELEVKVRTGELLEVEDVSKAWASQIMSAKSRLLGLGAKAAPMVLVASSATEAQAILDDLIRECLQELTDDYVPTSDEDINEQVLGATAEVKGKRLGRPK